MIKDNLDIKIEIEKDVLRKFPFDFENNVKVLLRTVPTEHLTQLNKIEIVNFSPQRKQKQSYGFYYGKREGVDTPTIIICVANLFGNMPKIIFYILPFIPRFLLADTLYHEIGHHYQRITHGIKKEYWEKDANSYSRFMKRKAFKQYKWVLFILFGPILLVRRVFRKLKDPDAFQPNR